MSTFSRAAGAALALLVALVGPLEGQRETVLKQIAVPHNYYYREMYLPQLTSGPSSAAWMPSGDELVYSMQGSLWRQKLGEIEAIQLVDGPGYAYQPDVSKDGAWIVYTAYLDDALELRVLETATGRAQRLLANGAVNLEPRFSPDGRRLAFVSTSYEGRWHVYVGDFADGTLSNVTRVTEDNDSELPRYYYSVYDHFLSPSWSPDGSELLLVSNRGRIWGTGGFWRIPVAGGALRSVHHEETTWKARPDWSPDGQRIVYASYLGRQWHQLWLTTAAPGGDAFQLTYGDFDAVAPRWSPDGSRIAFISNEAGGLALKVLAMPGGGVTDLTVQRRRWVTPRWGLSIQVTGPNGRSMPARVSVTAVDGRGYAPVDAWMHADDAFDRRERSFELTYFHASGTADLQVPAGRYVIEVTRGLEYRRAVDTVTVGQQSAVHRVRLDRLATLSGWWSGDLHVHMNYGGAYRNTPARLLAQAEAEDLRVVENLIVNKEGRIPDIAYFSRRLDQVSTSTTLIKHDEEYHTSYWGHTSLLGLTQNFVMPNYAGYVNTAAQSLFPHNTAIADLARSQGGIQGYVHPFEAVPDPVAPATLTHALPVDVALARIGYLEVVGFSDHRATASVWYRLLNLGFRIPAGAGTDAMANFSSLRGPVGLNRVFVRTPRLEYRPWLEGLVNGRTFVTNGPLLGLALSGLEPGDTLTLGEALELEARISLRSIVAVDSLELVRNGVVLASIPIDSAGTFAEASLKVRADRSGWYVLRAYATGSRSPTLDIYPYATTSPIYVNLRGQPLRSAEDARYFVAWIERLERSAAAHGGWGSDPERDRVLTDLARAKAIFLERGRE